jgi:hypothetical protein
MISLKMGDEQSLGLSRYLVMIWKVDKGCVWVTIGLIIKG